MGFINPEKSEIKIKYWRFNKRRRGLMFKENSIDNKKIGLLPSFINYVKFVRAS